jgi:hypothetical protein
VVCGNRLTVGISSTKVNRMTKKTTEQVAMMHQDLGDRMAGEPIAVMMHASGNRVLVASSVGEVISYRWDAISGSDKKDLMPEYQLQLSDYGVRAATVAAPLLGRETLLVGDANGAIVGVFEVRETAEQHQNGANRLAAVQRMEAGTAPVRTLASSPTDRVLASWTMLAKDNFPLLRPRVDWRDSAIPTFRGSTAIFPPKEMPSGCWGLSNWHSAPLHSLTPKHRGNRIFGPSGTKGIPSQGTCGKAPLARSPPRTS